MTWDQGGEVQGDSSPVPTRRVQSCERGWGKGLSTAAAPAMWLSCNLGWGQQWQTISRNEGLPEMEDHDLGPVGWGVGLRQDGPDDEVLEPR